jgi:hypothetical protein
VAFEECRRGHLAAQRIDARTRRFRATTVIDPQLTHFFRKAFDISFLFAARRGDVAIEMLADEVEPIADLARARFAGSPGTLLLRRYAARRHGEQSLRLKIDRWNITFIDKAERKSSSAMTTAGDAGVRPSTGKRRFAT